MSVSFFANPSDFSELLDAMFDVPNLTAWQTYPTPGAAPVKCTSASEVTQLLAGGEALVCFHAADVMPPPTIRIIDLHDGRTRSVVAGCGLFFLDAGFLSSSVICASTLSWFTESGARAKCWALPGPETVHWAKHKTVGARFSSLVRRRLKAASVLGRAVLKGALEAHRKGCQLKEHRNAPYALSVGAN